MAKKLEVNKTQKKNNSKTKNKIKSFHFKLFNQILNYFIKTSHVYRKCRVINEVNVVQNYNNFLAVTSVLTIAYAYRYDIVIGTAVCPAQLILYLHFF